MSICVNFDAWFIIYMLWWVICETQVSNYLPSLTVFHEYPYIYACWILLIQNDRICSRFSFTLNLYLYTIKLEGRGGGYCYMSAESKQCFKICMIGLGRCIGIIDRIYWSTHNILIVWYSPQSEADSANLKKDHIYVL